MSRLAISALAVSLLAFSGCSPSDAAPADSPDGGADVALDSFPTDVRDAGPADATVPDVVTDVVHEPEGPLCPSGSWGDVPNTECDMITQDCEDKTRTCSPSVSGPTAGSRCLFTGYGAKLPGDHCKKNLECASGSICLMNHCSRVCCPQAEAQLCGPGGTCSFNVNVGGRKVLYCSYFAPCTLWVNDCKDDKTTCIPKSDYSGARCVDIPGDEPLHEGDVCTGVNECDSSMACAGKANESSYHCRYYCRRGEPPWDAGAPSSDPGRGGCPANQTCGGLSGAPSWLGVCTPN